MQIEEETVKWSTPFSQPSSPGGVVLEIIKNAVCAEFKPKRNSTNFQNTFSALVFIKKDLNRTEFPDERFEQGINVLKTRYFKLKPHCCEDNTGYICVSNIAHSCIALTHWVLTCHLLHFGFVYVDEELKSCIASKT